MLKPFKCPRIVNGEKVVLVILAPNAAAAARIATEQVAARLK